MQNSPVRKNIFQKEQYLIWVLAPKIETDDLNLQYYYDFEQGIAEFSKAFTELDLHWKWQYVTLHNFKFIIDQIVIETKEQTPIIFNLCDGDEVNGAPGLSVVKYLEKKKIIYTGARETYYYLTTSKITMKRAFDKKNIASASWLPIEHPNQSTEGFCKSIGVPLIVKPAVSGGSMGLGIKNVVNDDEGVKNIVAELYKGYHGWDFTFGGLVAEKFIAGPEFTSFIVGSFDQLDKIIVYQPVERVFNNKLPEQEKFLSFDRLWDTYEDEKPLGGDEYENLYNYYSPSETITEAVKLLSIKAFCAVEGTGYGRIDIRMDKETGKLYVLEVNAQCGLSEDENYTSIGAMVRLGKHSYSYMIKDIIENAIAMERKAASSNKRKVVKKTTKHKKVSFLP